MYKGKHLTVIPENLNLFRLSVSKSKTFKSCKAKYKFDYIDRLPKKEQDFQAFGTFLHEVLENFHKELLSGSIDLDNIIMKKCFQQALPTYKPKLSKDQIQEAFEILKNYLTKREALKLENNLPKFICAEKKFIIQVDDIIINGFIDVIQEDPDGVLHVADYKTSKSKKYLKNDFMQLKTYAYAMCLEDPSLQKIRCSYVMLKFNFDSIVKEFTRDEVMVMEKEFQEYAELIKNERLFRPSPSPLCGYCDFLDHCPAGQDKMGISKSFGITDW